MARPRKSAPLDPFCDLDKKIAILEREMSAQRAAMDRLKQIAEPRPHQPRSTNAASHLSRLPR